MKQLGNLAVICAQRPELLMQLRGGLVLVQAKNRAAMEAAWNDDALITPAFTAASMLEGIYILG